MSHVAALPTLASNRLLGFAAASLIGMFLPIFWYEFFDLSIQAVLLWYILNFTFKLPFFIIGAKIFSRIGLVASMIIGEIGLSIFYLSVFFLDSGASQHPNMLIALGVIGLMVTSTMYWSPFHIDFAAFSKKGHRGRQIAAFEVAQQVIGVAGPIISALLIVKYGYKLSFLGGFFLIILSIIPLFYIPKVKVKYEFGYLQSWKELFSKKYRAMSLSMFAFGAETVVGIVIWPIFLFTVFKGNHLDIGIFAAVIIVVSIFLQLFIGKKTDLLSPKKMVHIGSGVYALGWVAKAFVSTVTGVFAASTFHSFGAIMLRTPLNAMMYEQAADSGHYVDEYTVLREMALCIGRIFILLLLMVVTYFFSLASSFLVAAFVSLGVNVLSEYHARKK